MSPIALCVHPLEHIQIYILTSVLIALEEQQKSNPVHKSSTQGGQKISLKNTSNTKIDARNGAENGTTKIVNNEVEQVAPGVEVRQGNQRWIGKAQNSQNHSKADTSSYKAS
ncbi:MAG: hypothetical protein QM752_03310 [Gammaproteobacteria bacterium]